MFYEHIEDVFDDSNIRLRSEVTDIVGRKNKLLFSSTFDIDSDGIQSWKLDVDGRTIEYRRFEDED